MAYTILENFKAGMVRNNTPVSNQPGSLYLARNVHLTQAGEIEKRQDILLLERWAAASTENQFFGLVATSDAIYTFGSEDY